MLKFLNHSFFLIFFQGRTPGESFVPKSQKEAEMEKMLKSMEVIFNQVINVVSLSF